VRREIDVRLFTQRLYQVQCAQRSFIAS